MSNTSSLRLVCISDTHNQDLLYDLPEGDVLIHGGDLTGRGKVKEIAKALDWLATYTKRYKKIILIAGNHDFMAQKHPSLMKSMCETRGLTYLFDSGVEYEGVKFWGSPWQPWFHDWAFNLEEGYELQEKWDLIPTDTDVLITHGPPYGIRDKCFDGRKVGCHNLLREVKERIKPKFHIFGHIHEDYGQYKTKDTTFINASTCNLKYKAINMPIEVEIFV